jgi:hypothetical protein
MNVTGVVHVDLASLVDKYGHIDEMSREARERWCQLETEPEFITSVRIDIGAAGQIDWPTHFVRRLTEARNVQIVGTYPGAVARAIEDISAIVDRIAAREHRKTA